MGGSVLRWGCLYSGDPLWGWFCRWAFRLCFALLVLVLVLVLVFLEYEMLRGRKIRGRQSQEQSSQVN